MQIKKILQFLKPYVAGKPSEKEEFIKLNANECPFDIPEKVYRKIAKIRNINRYHEGSGIQLRQKIAKNIGIDKDCVILGNGSGEIIKIFLETFVAKGEKIVVSEGTFSLYQLYGLINENQIKSIPLDSHLRIDLNLMAEESKDSKAVFLCNPNNPTGHAYSYEELEQFFKKIPKETGIFLDEAYIHYSRHYNEKRTKDLLEKYPNLIFLRTFSKIGLAGLRIGYALGTKEVIGAMHQVRPPFNINIYALETAHFILEKREWIKKLIRHNQKERKKIMQFLTKKNIPTIESEANFILIRSFIPDLDKKLEKKGILIRSAYSFGLPADYYRITIGKKKENKQFLKVLEEVLG